MAALSRRVKPLVFQAWRSNLALKRHISKANPLLGQWHEDWAVEKRPVTKEEHEAAAKKYGLLPEDYQPPTHASNVGDYPGLPMTGEDSLDPYADWDDPAMCRNYGQVIQSRWENTTGDRHDPSWQWKHSMPKMLAVLLSYFIIGITGIMIGEAYRIQQPRLEKQWPWGDNLRQADHPRIIHYTFEPAE